MENINVILHGKDIIFEKDEWKELLSEDEKLDYKISYKCKLYDDVQNKTKTIGMLKVWSNESLKGRETIDLKSKDDFKNKNGDNCYYSIGSDTYYDNLRTIFGDDYKEVLRYFNDISLLIYERIELEQKLSKKAVEEKKLNEEKISRALEEINKNTLLEFEDIKKYKNSSNIPFVKSLCKDIVKCLESEDELLKDYGSHDDKIYYMRKNEDIYTKELTIEGILFDLDKLRGMFSDKAKISRNLNHFSYQGYFYSQDEDSYEDPDDEPSEENKIDDKKNEIGRSYFENIVKKLESIEKKEFNNTVKEMHKKKNVTYQFNIASNNYTEYMNSRKGLYVLPSKAERNEMYELCYLFIKPSSPSIRRVGDIGKPLYYACDSPEQVMIIDGELNLNTLNEKIEEKSRDKERKEKNNTVYDNEYDYKKQNLFKKINLKQNPNVKNDLEHLRTTDKDVLVKSLKDSMDYESYKKHLKFIMKKENEEVVESNIEKNKDKEKDCETNDINIDETEISMILRICFLVSRNMFLIINERVSKECLEVIKNIMIEKNSICLYFDESNNDNKKLKKISDYIKKEKYKKIEN
ncbi:hypothetical protein RZ71_10410 [Apilactobacillus kunkeei]|uniref:Uncharacterized protein n=1 Tax=Apilactobacillus kunkeei TaxID=148814 RepID=A0A0N0CTF7_9LACO|nr:hypothetical protein [Apilactobacillus kunkeei]KOY77131.1 hypothetical protein RZ71_10410 [Apilactobacillus kunkeei]